MWIYKDKKGRSVLRYNGPGGAFLKISLKLLGVRLLELNRGIFSGSSIRFLERFDLLEGLFVTDWKLKNIQSVSKLPSLRFLHLSTPLATTLDLRSLPELTELGLDFAHSAANLESLTNLTDLFVGKLKWTSLSDLNRFESLRVAEFSEPAFKSIGHVNLPCLEELVLKGARDLADWTGIGRLGALRTLLIFKAPQLCSLSGMAQLAGLEWLLLEDCGTIDSLNPLTHLTSLRKINLVGDTRIADGKVSALLSLPNLEQVSIPVRQSDDMTASRVNEALRNRRRS